MFEDENDEISVGGMDVSDIEDEEAGHATPTQARNTPEGSHPGHQGHPVTRPRPPPRGRPPHMTPPSAPVTPNNGVRLFYLFIILFFIVFTRHKQRRQIWPQIGLD